LIGDVLSNNTSDTLEFWADDKEVVIWWKDVKPGDIPLSSKNTLSYIHTIKIPMQTFATVVTLIEENENTTFLPRMPVGRRLDSDSRH